MGMDALLLEIKHLPPGPKMVHSRSEMREDERSDMNILLLQAQDWVSQGQYFIFGALCPSKSGLMNKHIVRFKKQAGDACHLGSSSILRPIRDLVHCKKW